MKTAKFLAQIRHPTWFIHKLICRSVICPSIYMPIQPSIRIHGQIYASVHVPIHQSIHQSANHRVIHELIHRALPATPNIYASIIPACIHIHFSVRPFIHQSTYLPTLPAYPSVHPSVHPSMHPSRYVSIYSSIYHHAYPICLSTHHTHPSLYPDTPVQKHPSFTYQSIYLIWTPRSIYPNLSRFICQLICLREEMIHSHHPVDQ